MYTAFSTGLLMRTTLYAAFIFSIPAMGQTSFFFYTNVLQIPQVQMAQYNTAGSAGTLLGLALYPLLFGSKSIRWIATWGRLGGLLVESLHLILLTGANRTLCIPDITFLCLLEVAVRASQIFITVSISALIALAAPVGLEGDEPSPSWTRMKRVCAGGVSAVFCSTARFASLVVATQLGVLLMRCFGIDADNFEHIVAFKATELVIKLCSIGLFWLLPTADEINLSKRTSLLQSETSIGLKQKDTSDVYYSPTEIQDFKRNGILPLEFDISQKVLRSSNLYKIT